MLRSVISCARCFRYVGSSRPATFTFTKSLSATYKPRSANARRPASEKRCTASGCNASLLSRHHARRRHRSYVARREYPEHLSDGDATRRRRRKAAHAPLLVVGADGFALFHLIGGEVGDCEAAGVCVSAHRFDDVGGNVAGIKRIRIGSDGAQRRSECGISHRSAHGLRHAVCAVKVRGRSGVVLQVFLGGKLLVEPGDIGKPLLSASRIAGSTNCAQGNLPCCLCATSSMRTAPGVPTERPPTTAS